LIRKEAEKIVFPPLHDVVSCREWKTTAIHAVVQASARPDPEAIIAWIQQSFEKGKKLEDVHDTPRHLISLDGKVAAA
jgi:hypothetical protein